MANQEHLDKLEYDYPKWNEFRKTVQVLDFSNEDLRPYAEGKTLMAGKSFNEGDFSNVIMQRCDIHNAHFTKANLESADLSGADCRSTHFTDAQLQNATLKDANLKAAKFKGADITETNFDEAMVDGTDFEDVKNLERAINLDRIRIDEQGTKGKINEQLRNYELTRFNKCCGWDSIRGYG